MPEGEALVCLRACRSVALRVTGFEGLKRCDVFGSKQDLASVCGGIFFWRAEVWEQRGFWASAPDEMIMANDVNNEIVMLSSFLCRKHMSAATEGPFSYIISLCKTHSHVHR